MTRSDLRLLCTALGFTAVVAREGRGKDEASKAVGFARLIESFCLTTLPETVEVAIPGVGLDDDPTGIDRAIDAYKSELRDKQEARLPTDRASLLRFDDRLLLRKTRRQQRHFYATAHDAMIANRIVELVDEEINSEGDLM